VDFDVEYTSDTEAQKRRKIFCANWKGIQEHNIQFELGKVSFKKRINQWADLTFEEWKNKQRPVLAIEFPKDKTATEATEVDLRRTNCQSAWKKFLSDFNRIYKNDAETEKRRSIFCDNWQRIQEHNALYESGKVSHKKSINEWSDLKFEEWKKMQEPQFPSNMETLGNKTTEAEGQLCQDAWEKFLTDFDRKYKNDAEAEKRRGIFCGNWKRIQDHNLKYEEGKVSHKKRINQWSDLTFEEWKKIQEPRIPLSVETPVKTKASEIDQKGINCQAAWKKFITDFDRKYENDAETERRRTIFCGNWKRIQEHNALYESGKVSHKKGINQWSDLTFEEWKKIQEPHFPPNMETSGNKTKATEVVAGRKGSQ
ncbi:hypothetical protein KR054_000534, partial [Drosophila jambulina]